MSTVSLSLALFVPFSGIVAAISLLVMGASSYGSERPLSVRVVLWATAFSFASSAVQQLISAILLTDRPDPDMGSTLIAYTMLAIKWFITLTVTVTLWIHYQHKYAQTGRSAFLDDLAITSSSVDSRKPSKELANV